MTAGPGRRASLCEARRLGERVGRSPTQIAHGAPDAERSPQVNLIVAHPVRTRRPIGTRPASPIPQRDDEVEPSDRQRPGGSQDHHPPVRNAP